MFSLLRRIFSAPRQSTLPSHHLIMGNRPDAFCVSACVLGKWENLSQHDQCSDVIAEANELNRIVIGLPVRIIQSGRIVYELVAQTDESCDSARL